MDPILEWDTSPAQDTVQAHNHTFEQFSVASPLIGMFSRWDEIGELGAKL